MAEARAKPHRAQAWPKAPVGSATILLLMGVSGAGKTTVGQRLAERLHAPFVDGDTLHSSEAVAKMAAGLPLTDADRRPWLVRVHEQIKLWQDASQSGVLACSALKRVYRDLIFEGCPSARLIYLRGSEALISTRIKGRLSHFMPAALLASQFADLQEPAVEEQAIIVPVTDTPNKVAEAILQSLVKRVRVSAKEIAPQHQGEP